MVYYYWIYHKILWLFSTCEIKLSVQIRHNSYLYLLIYSADIFFQYWQCKFMCHLAKLIDIMQMSVMNKHLSHWIFTRKGTHRILSIRHHCQACHLSKTNITYSVTWELFALDCQHHIYQHWSMTWHWIMFC